MRQPDGEHNAQPGGTVAIGTALNDTATVVGGYNPTGNVTFNLYAPSDSTCSATPAWSQTVDLSGTSAVTSGGPAATSLGTYHWTATYNGDTNNKTYTSGCSAEAVVISQKSPSITTVASPTTGTVGLDIPSVSDQATATGGYGLNGQSVSFTLYGPNSCTTATTVTGTAKFNSSGVATYSQDWTPSAAGKYYWIASYIGDSNNKGFSTTCGDDNETVTISPVSPSITTVASPTTGTVGLDIPSVSDQATATGGYGLNGQSVSFTLYGPNSVHDRHHGYRHRQVQQQRRGDLLPGLDALGGRQVLLDRQLHR